MREIDIIVRRSMGLCLALAGSASNAQTNQPDAAATSQPTAATDRAALEQKFAALLTGAVLRGTWQMTGEEGLAGKAPLSEPQKEKYTVTKAVKLAGDYWIITARIQYADKDVTIPVPVRVVWAEDTPIITLNKSPLPGLGAYSARVMIYQGFYSGTWSGDCYGGILSGQIVQECDLAAVEAKEAGAQKAATQPAGSK